MGATVEKYNKEVDLKRGTYPATLPRYCAQNVALISRKYFPNNAYNVGKCVYVSPVVKRMKKVASTVALTVKRRRKRAGN